MHAALTACPFWKQSRRFVFALKRDRMPSKEKQDKRSSNRFRYETTVMFVSLAAGYYHEGRMENYCSEGLYFESDFPVEPKANNFVVIEKSPYSHANGFIKQL